MTLSLNDLLAAAHEATRSGSVPLCESRSELRCDGRWTDAKLLDDWRTIQSASLPSWIQLRIEDAADTEIDLTTQSFNDVKDQEFTVVVRKTLPAGAFVFLTLDGLRNGLSDETVEASARNLFVLQDFPVFSSHACRFIPLRDGTDISQATCTAGDTNQSAEVESGKLTRYLTRSQRPPRLTFWLQKEPPTAPSDVWHAWCNRAANRLVLVPVNEVWEDEAELRVALSGPKSGPRKRTLLAALEKLNATACFPALNEAVSCLVQVPREASVRHTYLTAELAREWPADDQSWADALPERLPSALEGAKAHYEAHLLETSRDVLKSLADLRKSVNEETGKAIDRTHSLLKALAGNLAAALGTLLFRLPALINVSASPSDRHLSQILFAILAVWMVFVCSFSLMVNHKFRTAMNASRNNWHTRIHAILSNTDFAQMASDPLDRAERVYNCAAVVVVAVYIAVSVSLAYLATDPFQEVAAASTHLDEPKSASPEVPAHTTRTN